MGPIVSKLKGDDRRSKMGAAAIIGNTPLLDLSRMSKTKGVKIPGQGGVPEPQRIHQGQDRAAHHRLRRARRQTQAGRHPRRVHLRQHRRRRRDGRRDPRVRLHRHHQRQVLAGEARQHGCVRAQLIVAKDGLPADHPEHYVNLEATLCERNASYFPVNQYENPDNPDAYYRTLGPEIWKQTRGRVTHFIRADPPAEPSPAPANTSRRRPKTRSKVLMPDPVGSVMYGAYHGDGKPVESGVLAAGKVQPWRAWARTPSRAR